MFSAFAKGVQCGPRLGVLGLGWYQNCLHSGPCWIPQQGTGKEEERRMRRLAAAATEELLTRAEDLAAAGVTKEMSPTGKAEHVSHRIKSAAWAKSWVSLSWEEMDKRFDAVLLESGATAVGGITTSQMELEAEQNRKLHEEDDMRHHTGESEEFDSPAMSEKMYFLNRKEAPINHEELPSACASYAKILQGLQSRHERVFVSHNCHPHTGSIRSAATPSESGEHVKLKLKNAPPDWRVSALYERLAGHRVAIVTGAGVSAMLAPDHHHVVLWTQFMKSLIRRIQAFLDRHEYFFHSHSRHSDLTQLADFLQARVDCEARGSALCVDYRHFVMELFEQVRPADGHTLWDPLSLPAALQALGSPIISTNYDVVMDRLLMRTPINLLGELLTAHRQKRLYSFLRHGFFRHEKFIYHVHGIYSDREGFTLSEEEYNRQASAFDLVMRRLLDFQDYTPVEARHSMLFVGVGEGMYDSHFRTLLRDVQSRSPETRHYWLVREHEVKEHEQRLRRHGVFCIDVLSYGVSFDDLVPFLWSLALAAGWKQNVVKITTDTRHSQEVISHITCVNGGRPIVRSNTKTSPLPPLATDVSQTIRIESQAQFAWGNMAPICMIQHVP